MDSIIKVTQNDRGDSVVSARDLHAFLESKQQFVNWIQNRIEKYGLIEGQDFSSLNKAIKRETGGTVRKEYALTLDCAKELSMVEGNERGKQARQYFISCERKLRERVPVVHDPVIAMHIRTLMELDAVKQEQERQGRELSGLREEVAVLEARTQPENRHFTVMGWARLNGVGLPLDAASKLGRKCAVLSRERGLPIGDVRDPRFGVVHSYHDSVLDEVFGERLLAG